MPHTTGPDDHPGAPFSFIRTSPRQLPLTLALVSYRNFHHPSLLLITHRLPSAGILDSLLLPAVFCPFTQRCASSKGPWASYSLEIKTEMAAVTESDSMPDSPLSEMSSPTGGGDEIDHLPTNGLRTEGAPFTLEKVYDYEPGGNHPVHLGDTLGDDRYRVIHKLGNGGFAIVWLCLDLQAGTPKYVAVKILMAEVSTDECPELVQGELLKRPGNEDGADGICLFLDHFRLNGPNGCHLCFVYPVLGPKVSSGLLRPSVDPNKTLRELCRSVVRSIAFLHKRGVCHGGQSPHSCSAAQKLTNRRRLHTQQCSAAPLWPGRALRTRGA